VIRRFLQFPAFILPPWIVLPLWIVDLCLCLRQSDLISSRQDDPRGSA
jgi:hypothetical protein